jgi:hypothetical protein
LSGEVPEPSGWTIFAIVFGSDFDWYVSEFSSVGYSDHLAAYRHVTAAFGTASDPLQFPDEGPPWQPSRLFYTAMLRSFFQKMR